MINRERENNLLCRMSLPNFQFGKLSRKTTGVVKDNFASCHALRISQRGKSIAVKSARRQFFFPWVSPSPEKSAPMSGLCQFSKLSKAAAQQLCMPMADKPFGVHSAANDFIFGIDTFF